MTEFGAEHSHDVQFYEFLQWHIDRQLAEVQAHALERGMRIGLYHDLALATDHWGADVWAHRPFYATGCRVGSPPDDFSPHGQDWAFPPPNRDAHRADGYELFAKVIRKTARHGGALRIDHVMRFFRLWWIPDEMPASDGAYVRDYAADLMGILKLESQRGGFIVIGEDLGTVTGEVRTALTEAGEPELPGPVVRASHRRLIQNAGRISSRGRGDHFHSRPADARRVFPVARYRSAASRRVDRRGRLSRADGSATAGDRAIEASARRSGF